MTEQYYLFRPSLNFWGSVGIIHTFLFKTNFMNRLKKHQWDHWSVPLLPICIWNVLREKPLHLLLTHPRYGIGLWMTHGSSKNRHSWITSTALIQQSSSLWKGLKAIPFLDTLVTPLADRSLSIKVYCKPTHTNQYLQWHSHHSLC